ncbi:MAG: peptidoglycan DD-metalloendopeptidase family protein [Flavobacteriales bacterium]
MKKYLLSVFAILTGFSLVYFIFIKDGGIFGSDEKVAIEKDSVSLRKYGFALDSFHVVEAKVKPNQLIADILLKYHIPMEDIDDMLRRGKDVFDVRKFKANQPYTVFCSRDSIQKAQYFIYEINAIEYVVYDMRDSMKVYLAKKPVVTLEQKASGIIYNSLYETMTDNGLSPALANELAEVYAWSIDFYRIQKGDKFKVIYDEQQVDGQTVAVKKIKAAMFEHSGQEYYAIYFEQDGLSGYYDQESRGLKRQFLKAPVKFSRISSRYTMKRFHPVQQRWKAHLGTDYAAPTGTPIMSTANGVVVEATHNRFNGNYVKVKHNSTYTTQYLHMVRIAEGIRRGKSVRQGEVIGYVGSTGLASGPHVCYRFWKNNKQVDALREKLPQSEPIRSANKEKFQEVADKFVEMLKEIEYKDQPVAVN